jgi:IS30 family transposase
MGTYTHLTEAERYQIDAMLHCWMSVERIARELGRHVSTIKRELRRNSGRRGYRAEQAQGLACARLRSRAQANARRIDPLLWPRVREYLVLRWSPEQIAGRLWLTERVRLSHESIYTHVYADKRAGGDLWRLLPCQKPRRRRCGAGRARRPLIPPRVPIEQRPGIVARRARFGDWEGDTLVDGSHQAAIVSLVERRSMYLLLAKVARRTTDQVCDAIVQAVGASGISAHTLTLDNGAEFCGHQRISQSLGMRCYFAQPYRAWQRGLNENHNGLVRRYIPKGQNLAHVTQADLQHIADALNNRPRKRLGYRTPNELILKHVTQKKGALRP